MKILTCNSNRPLAEAISTYLGLPLSWASEDEAADYLLTISQGFGPHSREQWMALTRPMLRRDGDPLASVRPGFTRNFTIYDDEDQISIVKAALRSKEHFPFAVSGSDD